MRLVCVYGVDEENMEDRENGTDGTNGTNGKFPSSEATPSLPSSEALLFILSSEATPSLPSSEAIPFIPAPAHLSQRTDFTREASLMRPYHEK